MEDSSDDDSYMSESVSSNDGRVRSNRGSVTQSKTIKRRRVRAKSSTSYKKPAPAYKKERFLEEAGELRGNDVILGRGPNVCKHEGNKLFRFLCFLARPVYMHSGTSRRWKSEIASMIVKQVASLDPPGRFVESDGDKSMLYLVPKGKVLEKTCQALRERKMACPQDFRKLAQNLEGRGTKEEKAKLLASGTGVDLKTITDVQDEMDSIIKRARLEARFMGKNSGFRSTHNDHQANSGGLSRQDGSHVRPVAAAPVPRSHGPEKVDLKSRISASDAGAKRAAPKQDSRKTPLKPIPVEDTVSRESKSIQRQPASVRRTTKRKSDVSTKPAKKRRAVDSNDDPKPLVPKKGLRKSPRHLESSTILEASPERVETPDRKRWIPTKLPTSSSHDSKPGETRNEQAAEPSATPDDSLTFSPSVAAFLSGIFSSGTSAGSPKSPDKSQTPPRMAPTLGIESHTAKKQEVGEASPTRASALPPDLTSLISDVYGPNHQDWLNAIAKNQECISGATLDAASLMPPQLSSFLSGMFGDTIDFTNVTSVEEALERLPPTTLANRLSGTLLTPMQSWFGTKPRDLPSPPKGLDVASPACLMPPESIMMTAKHDSTRCEAKPSAGAIVCGVSVTEWRKDSAGRLDNASPLTVIEKNAGVVAGSAKSARSLLDDDGDEEAADAKVQAARRLSLGSDLFHHNDQPL